MEPFTIEQTTQGKEKVIHYSIQIEDRRKSNEKTERRVTSPLGDNVDPRKREKKERWGEATTTKLCSKVRFALRDFNFT